MLPGMLLFTNLVSGWMWWLAATPYFYISQLYYKGRFGLMFHCMCHRKTFKKRYQWLHTYITWAVCPFFGQAPEGYFSHHIGMHHIENNMPEDTSSTMYYQRDSLQSFLRYYFTFLAKGVSDTLSYLYRRKRKIMYERFRLGEACFFIFCICMLFVNPKAVMTVFIIPLFFGRMVSMLGNWTQHAFVDAYHPDDPFKNSINCINTAYNKMCWNDGYHVIHHLRPGLHYTDMPGEFLKRKGDFAKNKALVFDGIHYLHIFFYLMTKRYDKLAENLVNIDNTFGNNEEAIALMKKRTKKISVWVK